MATSMSFGGTTTAAGAPELSGGGLLSGYMFKAQGTQHVVYGTDGAGVYNGVGELWWDSNSWHYNELTAAAAAPKPYTDPNGYMFNVDPNFPLATQHVVYVQALTNGQSDDHICELYWVPD
ncbi:MAG: hypothetical protein ACR2JB_20890 [Bryobacteraceae bacterium]